MGERCWFRFSKTAVVDYYVHSLVLCAEPTGARLCGRDREHKGSHRHASGRDATSGDTRPVSAAACGPRLPCCAEVVLSSGTGSLQSVR